jgi:hypothetical protein
MVAISTLAVVPGRSARWSDGYAGLRLSALE